MNKVLKLSLCLMLSFFFSPARAEGANVNVRVNTPAGEVEINRPPPQPVVVVQPPAERVVVEKKSPPPAPPPAAPPPPPAPGGCHCSLVPVTSQTADFLIFAPVLSLLWLRRVGGRRRLSRFARDG